jgi:hypothetical protein
MRKNILALLFSTTLVHSSAQIVVSPNQSANDLVAALVATSGTAGIIVSNQTLTCDSSANGLFSATSNLGITDGITLSTGKVSSLPGISTAFSSETLYSPGDAQLATLLTVATYDACALEFDLQPVGGNIQFEYIFGSEEYTAFNCSPFNDIFGFFISGPGYPTATNIALVPTTTTPVSINSINDGTGGCAINTALYVNNVDTFCTLNGFTLPILAQATVAPAATYHLKLVIADVSDGILNSAVIIKSNSLKSSASIPNAITILKESDGLTIYPTVFDNSVVIQNKINGNWIISLRDISGREVVSNSIMASKKMHIINTQSLVPGMYILDAKNEANNQHFVQKVIKK